MSEAHLVALYPGWLERYDASEAVYQPGEPTADDADERQERYQRIEALISRLPPLEQDVLDLRYRLNKSEAEIGQVLGYTQAGISWTLARAHERLRFLASWAGSTLTDKTIRSTLGRLLPTAKVDLVCTYLATLSRAEAARREGRHYITARRWVAQAIAVLEPLADHDASAAHVYQALHTAGQARCILGFQDRWKPTKCSPTELRATA